MSSTSLGISAAITREAIIPEILSAANVNDPKPKAETLQSVTAYIRYAMPEVLQYLTGLQEIPFTKGWRIQMRVVGIKGLLMATGINAHAALDDHLSDPILFVDSERMNDRSFILEQFKSVKDRMDALHRLPMESADHSTSLATSLSETEKQNFQTATHTFLKEILKAGDDPDQLNKLDRAFKDELQVSRGLFDGLLKTRILQVWLSRSAAKLKVPISNALERLQKQKGAVVSTPLTLQDFSSFLNSDIERSMYGIGENHLRYLVILPGDNQSSLQRSGNKFISISTTQSVSILEYASVTHGHSHPQGTNTEPSEGDFMHPAELKMGSTLIAETIVCLVQPNILEVRIRHHGQRTFSEPYDGDRAVQILVDLGILKVPGFTARAMIQGSAAPASFFGVMAATSKRWRHSPRGILIWSLVGLAAEIGSGFAGWHWGVDDAWSVFMLTTIMAALHITQYKELLERFPSSIKRWQFYVPFFLLNLYPLAIVLNAHAFHSLALMAFATGAIGQLVYDSWQIVNLIHNARIEAAISKMPQGASPSMDRKTRREMIRYTSAAFLLGSVVGYWLFPIDNKYPKDYTGVVGKHWGLLTSLIPYLLTILERGPEERPEITQMVLARLREEQRSLKEDLAHFAPELQKTMKNLKESLDMNLNDHPNSYQWVMMTSAVFEAQRALSKALHIPSQAQNKNNSPLKKSA